ncbi:MAG: hypothetical protein ABEJ57_00730 [Halobacteriaceae archaeon]
MSNDKDQWKQTAGLAADSTVAQIVCKEPDKEEWDEEAEEKGYRSTSKYLYELIQEARAYRQQGYLAHHQSEEKIADLNSRIEELEAQLKRERKKESATTNIDDIGFLEQFLSTEYQTLPEILQDIVESGPLDDLIRKPVEDELYYLASQDRVEYERGHGWRLTNGGGEDGR